MARRASSRALVLRRWGALPCGNPRSARGDVLRPRRTRPLAATRVCRRWGAPPRGFPARTGATAAARAASHASYTRLRCIACRSSWPAPELAAAILCRAQRSSSPARHQRLRAGMVLALLASAAFDQQASSLLLRADRPAYARSARTATAVWLSVWTRYACVCECWCWRTPLQTVRQGGVSVPVHHLVVDWYWWEPYLGSPGWTKGRVAPCLSGRGSSPVSGPLLCRSFPLSCPLD